MSTEAIARQEFADYHGKLYGIARVIGASEAALIGVPTYDDLAEDIVAEAFFSYCRWRLTNEPIDGDFSAAIRQSMRLVAGRCLKRRARQWNREPVLLAGRPSATEDAPDVALVEAPADEFDPAQLLRAIRDLPDDLAPIAYYVATNAPDRPADKSTEFAAITPSCKQIAEALGISPPTVAKRLRLLSQQPSMLMLYWFGGRSTQRACA